MARVETVAPPSDLIQYHSFPMFKDKEPWSKPSPNLSSQGSRRRIYPSPIIKQQSLRSAEGRTSSVIGVLQHQTA